MVLIIAPLVHNHRDTSLNAQICTFCPNGVSEKTPHVGLAAGNIQVESREGGIQEGWSCPLVRGGLFKLRDYKGASGVYSGTSAKHRERNETRHTEAQLLTSLRKETKPHTQLRISGASFRLKLNNILALYRSATIPSITGQEPPLKRVDLIPHYTATLEGKHNDNGGASKEEGSTCHWRYWVYRILHHTPPPRSWPPRDHC